MLVVLDTNVLISSQLNKKGNEAKILEYRRQGFFQIVVSEAIFQEYTHVLNYPHIQAKLRWTPEHLAQFLIDLRKVLVFTKVHQQEPISPDPHDDMFFHCAKAANADFLVSGDEHHILPISAYGTTITISPKAFFDMISSEHQRAA